MKTMSLRDVIGQDRALRMIRGAMKSGRLAASYLFAGEDGIGKKFAALNLARALNCLDPVDAGGARDACGRCASCRKIDSGSHPDFVLLAPENSLIKVEQVRRLEEALSYKSFEGGLKVAVVDEAETMNASAANAFLKTLEEPPPGSLIILVSSRPDKLPATIRSRCSRINFRPLSPADCGKVLGKAGRESEALHRLSMGRPGLAAREDLLAERESFLDVLRRMLSGEGKPVWAERRDMERWIDMALIFLRDMAAAKVAGTSAALINGDMAERLRAMGARASLEGIIECNEKLGRLRDALLFNLNKGITWNYASSLMGELNIHV